MRTLAKGRTTEENVLRISFILLNVSPVYPPVSTFIAFILVPATLIVFALLSLKFHRCIQHILITSIAYSPPQTAMGNPPSDLSHNFRSSIFIVCVCVSTAGVEPRVLHTPALLKGLLQFPQTSLEPALLPGWPL